MASPVQKDRVALEPFLANEHKHTLDVWLNLAHVARWWIDPPWQLAQCLNPRAHADHRVITVDGIAIGYLRFEPLHPRDLFDYGITHIPDNAMDFDIFIGESNYLYRGVGPIAIEYLKQHLRENTATEFLMLSTSVRNTSAIRAYEKSQFTAVTRFDGGRYGPSILMSTSLYET